MDIFTIILIAIRILGLSTGDPIKDQENVTRIVTEKQYVITDDKTIKCEDGIIYVDPRYGIVAKEI